MTLMQPTSGRDFCALLSELQATTGVLAFHSKAGKFCLHLRSSIIQAVFVNGRPLRDSEQARELLESQLQVSPSKYQFEEALPEDLRKGMSISVQELLENAPADCSNAPQESTTGFWQKMFGRFVS